VRDSFGGHLHRANARDECRRLAAEFQRHRRQVLRSRPHDVMAHRRRAGEHEMIERQVRKRLRLRHLAPEHCDFVLREMLGEHLRQQFGGARRQLRHLDHHPVAGGQCSDQRTQ
jgi:hypothetical protein